MNIITTALLLFICLSVVSVACSEPEDKFTSADVQATVEASVLQDRQLEATSEAKVKMMVEATVQAISSEKTPTKEIVLTPTSIPNPTATKIPTPLPNKKSSNLSTLAVIPTKIPTPIPVPMNAAEVYDLVSESIVFVESPIFTGSGILLNNNYVITNAHIIWPHEMADITLTSGKTYKDVPLVKQDFGLDLSLLGPLDLDQSNRNLNISSGEALPIGSDVFLIGYPGESVRKENPSITQGIISNFKEYKPRETTLILTDATIAGGQSGGAIISEDGSVLGITGWSMTEAMIGMAISFDDIGDFMEPPVPGDKDLVKGLLEGIEKGLEVELNTSDGLEKILYIDAEAGDHIEISINSDQAFVATVYDAAYIAPLYYSMGVDAAFSMELPDLSNQENSLKSQSIDIYAETTGPQFLWLETDLSYYGIEWNNLERKSITLKSNFPLKLIDDSHEEYARLERGKATTGTLQFPGDVDSYEVLLTGGTQAKIRVESFINDTYISLFDYQGDFEPIVDDDSGGGPFSTDSEITFDVPETNYYLIVVEDILMMPGEYVVTVTEE